MTYEEKVVQSTKEEVREGVKEVKWTKTASENEWLGGLSPVTSPWMRNSEDEHCNNYDKMYYLYLWKTPKFIYQYTHTELSIKKKKKSKISQKRTAQFLLIMTNLRRASVETSQTPAMSSSPPVAKSVELGEKAHALIAAPPGGCNEHSRSPFCRIWQKELLNLWISLSCS